MAVLRLAEQEVDTGGEVMSEAAARRLTAKIRKAGADLAELVRQAHDEGAYLAMGYENWAAYVAAELDVDVRQSQNLILQGRAQLAIAAAPVPAVTRYAPPRVSIRQARALGTGLELNEAVAEFARLVEAEVEPSEALAQVAGTRKPGRPRVIPATSRETNGHGPDPEAIMAAAADLRPRLRAWLEEVKAAVRNAPKANQEADTPEALLDEMHDWVATMAAITADNRLKPVYRLMGETYVIAKAIGGSGERAVLAEISDCTIGNIDYRVNAL